MNTQGRTPASKARKNTAKKIAVKKAAPLRASSAAKSPAKPRGTAAPQKTAAKKTTTPAANERAANKAAAVETPISAVIEPKVGAPKTAPTTHDTPAKSALKYPTVALVLQGGGALGSYQCGVYEGLHKAGIQPNWFAGISIGAINAAILAGNAPEQRIERLHAFWDRITVPAVPLAQQMLAWQSKLFDTLKLNRSTEALTNQQGALAAILFGQSGFYTPRMPPPGMPGATHGEAATSYYSTDALRKTLEEFVDFDRINRGDVRFSVAAVNVQTGNFVNFDNLESKIRVEHVLASGALPPAFPAIEIDGEHYWDGGVVSNTPLDHVLGSEPHRDCLVFQVDLWRAQGILPRNMMEVTERQKDIQYSSRTRFNTAVIQQMHDLRTTLNAMLKQIPQRHISAELRKTLEPWLSDRVYNIIHLIYKTKPFEEQYKDYSFAPSTMREHWHAGLHDMQRTLHHPEFFAQPSRDVGVVTHDVHR
jgi:NTE family protein